MKSPRGAGACGWLAPSERLELGAKVRAQLQLTPKAKIAELVQLTRAPADLVMRVRRKMLEARP